MAIDRDAISGGQDDLCSRVSRNAAGVGSSPRQRRRGPLALVGFACLLLVACASNPAPMIDNDLEAFTAGIDGVLKVGMNIKEAKAALRAKMPPPAIDTEVAAPVPSANIGQRTRRFMISWPTFDRGTSLVLTIFCDRQGTVVRWTTGPLKEDK